MNKTPLLCKEGWREAPGWLARVTRSHLKNKNATTDEHRYTQISKPNSLFSVGFHPCSSVFICG
jgi:hypothetical protein